MKILLLLFALPLSMTNGFAVEPPVHWRYEVNKVGPDEFKLSIIATMDQGWHIYSQFQPKEHQSEPTAFEFLKNPLLVYEGKVKESGTVFHYHDDVSGIKQD